MLKGQTSLRTGNVFLSIRNHMTKTHAFPILVGSCNDTILSSGQFVIGKIIFNKQLLGTFQNKRKEKHESLSVNGDFIVHINYTEY
jgi:hypothetical protein